MYFDLNLVLKAYLDSLARDPKAVPYINSLDLTGNHYDSIYTTSNERVSFIRHRVMSQTRETKAYLKVNISPMALQSKCDINAKVWLLSFFSASYLHLADFQHFLGKVLAAHIKAHTYLEREKELADFWNLVFVFTASKLLVL